MAASPWPNATLRSTASVLEPAGFKRRHSGLQEHLCVLQLLLQRAAKNRRLQLDFFFFILKQQLTQFFKSTIIFDVALDFAFANLCLSVGGRLNELAAAV